ncbi:hypothetical protein Q5X59_14880 [Acinetobacter baumannii]|nr:hypothetical protein [Acinetobacter baumannii]
MDKKALQEQFEVIAIQNGWNINKYPAGWDSHSDDEYVDELVNGAWWVFQHQQAKVEELEKEWLEMNQKHEQAVKECFEVNDENRKLQQRVKWLEDRLKATDTLSKMRAAVIGSFNTQEFNARTRRKMMILKQAEQALKGGA